MTLLGCQRSEATTPAPSNVTRSATPLFFVSEGKLQTWDPDTNSVDTLISSGVVKYEAMRNNILIVAVEHDSINDSYGLVVVDAQSGEEFVLLEQVHCLHDFDASPSSNQLVFIAGEWDAELESCAESVERGGDLFANAIHDQNFGYPFPYNLGGTISVVDVHEGPIVKELGHCRDIGVASDMRSEMSLCVTAFWTPDGNYIIWHDADGIWQVEVSTGQKDHLETASNNLFLHFDFSPSGQFLAIHGYNATGGQTRQVLNLEQRVTYRAPHSNQGFFGLGAHVEMSWGLADDLIFAHPDGRVERWVIDETLGAIEMAESIQAVEIGQAVVVSNINLLQDGSILFALASPYQSETDNTGIFRLTTLDEVPERLVELVQLADFGTDYRIHWSKGSEQALIEFWQYETTDDAKSDFYYLPSLNGELERITDVIGSSATSFYWAEK